MTNQISILGCGWLGLPLANFLIKSGFVVKGSTTNLDKISILENNKIQAFQIELSEIEIKGEIDSFLKNSEILMTMFSSPKQQNQIQKPRAGSNCWKQKLFYKAIQISKLL